MAINPNMLLLFISKKLELHMNIYFIQNFSKIHKYHKSGIFSEHPMNFFTLFSLSLFASPAVGTADHTLTSCTHPFHWAHLAAAWEH